MKTRINFHGLMVLHSYSVPAEFMDFANDIYSLSLSFLPSLVSLEFVFHAFSPLSYLAYFDKSRSTSQPGIGFADEVQCYSKQFVHCPGAQQNPLCFLTMSRVRRHWPKATVAHHPSL